MIAAKRAAMAAAKSPKIAIKVVSDSPGQQHDADHKADEGEEKTFDGGFFSIKSPLKSPALNKR